MARVAGSCRSISNAGRSRFVERMCLSVSARTWPDYQRHCGWNALLPPRESAFVLRGDHVSDVVVIGAGYTGLAAARRVAEQVPESRIIVLEASTVGEGNPGRNSGFLLEVSLANDADPQAVQRMAECNRLVAGAMRDLADLVRRYHIDCNLVRAGTYRAAAGETGIAALRRYRAFLDAAGLPYETLQHDEIHRRLGTRFYREGLYSPHCYLVQPAALIRGLAGALPDSVTLFEKSPAVTLARRNATWSVRTPDGSVSAPNVIVANNAFCTRLGVGRARIAAIYTYAALTEPLSQSLLDDLGSDPNWGLLPAHRLGSTLRRTIDGRLLVRSLYGYEKEADNARTGVELLGALLARFPQATGTRFETIWSGATGFTTNGGPLWGRLEPGLFISAGCNGGGVVKGTIFGQAIADRVLDRKTVDIPALFGRPGWMPPEPLRRIGFHVISAMERSKGHAEV